MRTKWWPVATAVILGLRAAISCGGPAGSEVVSTGADGGVGTHANTTGDGGVPSDGGGSTDGATDAGQDVGIDAGQDGGTGAGQDAGIDAGQDAGIDAGQDAGQDAGIDAGQDAGADAGTITFPDAEGWTFYGPQHGGPQDVYDVAFDEGGNLWVAGGAEGLFVLKPGAATFQRFGLADGLHPYGYLNGDVARSKGVPDGSPADTSPSLAATPVIPLAGGPAGTVFVGYQGKPDCESAWTWECNVKNPDGTCLETTPPSTWGDPAVYKSGDADRVTLSGSGISVVHYDIFSGPNVVAGETGGREKLCTIDRVVWDKAQDRVWFGGNHGFAVGKASYAGDSTCNGEYDGFQAHPDCAGVWEHSHPAISGCQQDTNAYGNCPTPTWLTDAYFGISVDPQSHDVWFGGSNRSTVFHYGTYGGSSSTGGGLDAYYKSHDDTEGHDNMPPQSPGYCTAHNPDGAGITCGADDRLDIWKDNKPECTPVPRSTSGECTVNYLGPSDRIDDAVSGMAAIGGGKAWVGSFAHGLVVIDAYGNTLADITDKLLAKNVSAVALDPKDGSVWAGMAWGLGITRYDPAHDATTNYSFQTFGDKLTNAPIANIQASISGRMAVGFHANGGLAGAVGVYDGK